MSLFLTYLKIYYLKILMDTDEDPELDVPDFSMNIGSGLLLLVISGVLKLMKQ